MLLSELIKELEKKFEEYGERLVETGKLGGSPFGGCLIIVKTVEVAKDGSGNIIIQ